MPLTVVKRFEPITAALGWEWVDKTGPLPADFARSPDYDCGPCGDRALLDGSTFGGPVTVASLRKRGTIRSLLGVPNLMKPSKVTPSYNHHIDPQIGGTDVYKVTMKLRLQSLATSVDLIAEQTFANNEGIRTDTVGAIVTLPAALQEPDALAEVLLLVKDNVVGIPPGDVIAHFFWLQLASQMVYKLPF